MLRFRFSALVLDNYLCSLETHVTVLVCTISEGARLKAKQNNLRTEIAETETLS